MKSVVVRRLTEGGIARFRELLTLLRGGMPMPHAPAILFDDTLTERVRSDLLIEPRRFATKYDAAVYLREALRPIDRGELASDAGLWSWLALFYFDQLVPPAEDGTRKPRADYHYVPDESHAYGLRHLLAGPYRIVAQHGEAARLILRTPLHRFGSLLFQLTWRQELMRNRAVVELIDRLYFDAKSGRPKRGATRSEKDGSVQRLFAVLAQLEVNYDLHGMTAAQIVELLPPEFDAWRA
ncbi:MAG: hypothetical protein LC732_07200 [Acidobacteria bacterium]|nr:hypothetical protein [Acidobacteriota bacterium]